MNKWKMNRAGLLNFWYYDEEIFHFADGKLLLRGSNGSGKSVTMQSFLPVLLDGKTSPDRLDPFGSKARRMEDYLLGEKDIVNRDERTGYLFLEFKREGTDQYTTIGIGLQAKRNTQMKFWGFVLTDNRRIGEDFDLYKIENNAGIKQKIPLSRIELENMINDGGHIVQTKREYMQLVNKYVFGFETMEAYEDLIKLLIQLRSPKLSKDFRPTVIYEILESALPPLSDEDLRHLSDTIEQMDQTKQQIEQLEREVAAIRNLNQVYHAYNQRILVDQANDYLVSKRHLAKQQKEQRLMTETLETFEKDIDQLTNEITDLTIRRKTYEKQEERLKSHKVWNLEKERLSELEKLEQELNGLNKKHGQLQDKRQRKNTFIIEKNKLEEQMGQREENIEDKLLDMANDAEEASFVEAHDLNQQDFSRHKQAPFDFNIWAKEATKHLSHLEMVEKQLHTFEHLKVRYQDKDMELANESKQLDDATYQEQEWTHLFEEDKERKLNDIHAWFKETPWLHISNDIVQETSRGLHSLYEPTHYDKIKEPFRQAAFSYEQQQRERLSRLNFDKQQLENKLQEKQLELKEWKEKKDPEPLIDPLTKEARQTLDVKGIRYVPFYSAVEFQDHVDQEVRKRIEAAIMDSGILDALIVENAFDVKHDRVLIPSPQMMAFTLADYLKPDVESSNSIPPHLVDEILRSILIEDDGTQTFSINEQGHYQMGLLKGHALPVADVRYIGRNARKRFREEQIQSIEKEIADLMERKDVLNKDIQQVNTQISEVKLRLDQFPDDDDLQESFKQIKEVRLEIEHHERQIKKLSEELRTIYSDYTEVKRQIDSHTRGLNIEVSLSSYQEAIQVAKRYEKELNVLEKEHIQFVHDLNRIDEISSRLGELEEEILEIQGDINISQSQVSEYKENIKQIEMQLEEQGVTDIRQQITEVQQVLKEIEKTLKEKETTKPRIETEKKHVEENVLTKNKQIDFWTKLTQTWEGSFEQEIHRGFIDLEAETEGDLNTTADEVVKKYGHLLKEKDRGKLSSQLTQEFYKQQSDLMEYRPNSFNAPVTLPTWMNEVSEEEYLPHIDQWKQRMARQLIELDFQGKQVSPYTVQQQIELEQARQESFLDEQDQALYEEILFNSVGQKLRARIRRAEQWVDKMKHLMESRDTSSGLSFSIKWKPRTADSETEMDTVDLVHLLRQDPKLLREEDLEKITTHFRSKIAKAKEMMGDSSELQTLLQVLKEVLDYRKWFSFVLYFQREGEKKRELNNNQFYKFSGGEKAMAMYIPLFTACYSRYLEANQDAPYIISLDEAFAGVDENNIREMFEIVEQLGFNYIMNSQVLWGDYDTISRLSICELVRPKNADFVSVIRYHWDGNRMVLDIPTEIEEETLV